MRSTAGARPATDAESDAGMVLSVSDNEIDEEYKGNWWYQGDNPAAAPGVSVVSEVLERVLLVFGGCSMWG